VTAHAFSRIDDAVELAPAITATAAPLRGLAFTAQHLQKSFSGNRVLRDISLHVPAGQFVAIVGRSGCGKSTLLRLLVGLDRPSGGCFWFGDREEAADKQAVRVMFQEPRLLPWSKALANVEVGLGAVRGSPEGRERALATLREVGLEDRRNDCWSACGATRGSPRSS
jgi:sulfonate transport system ATP-binding protein